MFYMVTVVIQRRNDAAEPMGVTEVQVTSEIKASSWADAVGQATEHVLDDHVKGGLVGSRIVSVEARAS